MAHTLLVTGASGHLGRLVVEELAKTTGHVIISGTRTPEKLAARSGIEVRRADFDDAASLDVAFAGVDRLLIISTDALGVPMKRARQHGVAIDAAKRAGVKHIVYTSAPKADTSPLVLAPDHKATEEALSASGLGYTVLRHNWYAQALLGSLPAAIASGRLYTAAGDGRIAYVAREDCALADAAALASGFEGKRVVEITGPEALSAAQVAAIASEVTGKNVAAVQLTEAQMAAGMKQAGLPPPVADFLAAVDTNVKDGALDIVSPAFVELTGRAPMTVRAFLMAHRAELG